MSHFPSDYEHFIYKSRYARWLEEEGRRENWPETIDRYLDFMQIQAPIRDHLLEFKTMPSMRALMTAGPALARDNTAGFNCAYLPVNDPRCFDEAMYILLCGTGVGFSVEEMEISQLPVVPARLIISDVSIIPEDSKEGWATSCREMITHLYAGYIPYWDVSKIRPAGARLKTFGGRASGPDPLVKLFKFLIETFRRAQGRQLTPIECHDIMCKIGEIVVVGGVRRSAMISLSDLSDQTMARAKSMFKVLEVTDLSETSVHLRFISAADVEETLVWEHTEEDAHDLEQARAGTVGWWVVAPQRALANNSAVYLETPTQEVFSHEWQALIDSQSGERGIFSRAASETKVQSLTTDRETGWDWGTNPCCEITLRPYQFCNLTEVVARAGDTLEELLLKVETASIMGTYQARLTDFPYLRPIWQENTEAERLLGVSLTGIMDHGVLNGSEGRISLIFLLGQLRRQAREVNELWADRLGILPAAAITCVKPSGTVSQLVNSASGIHARYSKHYIRTIRADNKDPMTKFMASLGFPNEPDVMKPEETTIFSFPIQAPDVCVTREDQNAIEQLELWLIYATHWCDHKPSVTISVRADEWEIVGEWVLSHFDHLSGISFLPYADHTYKQAPYQPISAEQFLALQAEMPEGVDWSLLSQFESEDNTAGAQTLACSGGVCEMVDLT